MHFEDLIGKGNIEYSFLGLDRKDENHFVKENQSEYKKENDDGVVQNREKDRNNDGTRNRKR